MSSWCQGGRNLNLMFNKVNHNVTSRAGAKGVKIDIVVYQVDQNVISWCQVSQHLNNVFQFNQSVTSWCKGRQNWNPC
jgi:hypothetical protein